MRLCILTVLIIVFNILLFYRTGVFEVLKAYHSIKITEYVPIDIPIFSPPFDPSVFDRK